MPPVRVSLQGNHPPMITSLHIKNFKCLLDTKVQLSPFTVLIGPNDSGKTSFLDAIRLLGQTTQQPFPGLFGGNQKKGQSGQLSSLVWRRETDRSIFWRVTGQTERSFEYELQLPASGGFACETLILDGLEVFRLPEREPSRGRQPQRDPNHTELLRLNELAKKNVARPLRDADADEAIDWLCEALSSTEEYRLNPDAMRTAAKAETHPSLSASGDNLASVLNSLLTGPDRAAVVELENKLHEAIPTLRGLSTPAAKDGSGSLRQIEFALSAESKPPITIPSSQASDGAMLLTAYLALAYGDTPQVLLIEEPENGLHPSRLQMVIDILRKMSKGEIGNRARQIVLTTHSPLLLNFVQPEDVRIFQRNSDGATEVTPMHELPNVERLHSQYAPGELWYLFGEEELINGNPA